MTVVLHILSFLSERFFLVILFLLFFFFFSRRVSRGWMRETICFRVFHFYRIDIKSSRYAFKELATLFIELIEHHIISSFYRKRKPVLPKPPRGKVSRNALLINGEGNGARQRAIMTLWERERDGACATSGPTIWMQKESSQNLIFFIVFCNGTDVHNQDPLPPTPMGISWLGFADLAHFSRHFPSPTRGRGNEVCRTVSQTSRLLRLLSQPRGFSWEWVACTRKRCAHTDTDTGREEREGKGKRKPAPGYEKLYVTFK